MNTKTFLLCLAVLLSSTALTLVLCAATLHFAHNYTNQATQPHPAKLTHKP